MKIANYFLATLSLAVARSAVATAVEEASSLDAHDTGDAPVDAMEEVSSMKKRSTWQLKYLDYTVRSTVQSRT